MRWPVRPIECVTPISILLFVALPLMVGCAGPAKELSPDVSLNSSPGLELGPFPRDLNLILISIDTLRPDHLSAYGYDRPTSPTIDDLASDGLVFEAPLEEMWERAVRSLGIDPATLVASSGIN